MQADLQVRSTLPDLSRQGAAEHPGSLSFAHAVPFLLFLYMHSMSTK